MSFKAERLATQLSYEIAEQGGHVPCMSAPDIFFADREEDNPIWKIKAARDLCADCPVRQLCADYAMEAQEMYGVWGGFTARELTIKRRALQVNRARATEHDRVVA